jgi:hypothetical protein
MYMWQATNHNSRTSKNDFENRKNNKKSYSCKDMACVVLLPSVLLSLVLIGVFSLLIYLHLLQEYHAEIDKLKYELQAARDKDGVFLPKETFDEQNKLKENAEKEIREKTLLLKALEEELEKFKVCFLTFLNTILNTRRMLCYSPRFHKKNCKKNRQNFFQKKLSQKKICYRGSTANRALTTILGRRSVIKVT